MTLNGDEYVRFDEREDVLASLQLLSLIAPQLEKQGSLWKWMIIGAENALQGAMVCALADSTGTSVLSKRSAAEMLDWLQNNTEDRGSPPEEWLKSFGELLDKCVAEVGLVLTPQQRKDIDRLHEYFRNQFVHFTPKGWGIEKSGLPRIVLAALDAVAFLIDLPRSGVLLDGEQRKRLTVSLEGTKIALNAYCAS